MSHFVGGEMGILGVVLDNINLDHINFDEKDPGIIIMSDLKLDRLQ